MKTKSKLKLQGFVSVAIGYAILGGVSDSLAAPRIPDATSFMDWAQTALSTYFPGQLPDISSPPYLIRGPYSTGHYMGVSGSTVYVLGPATGNTVFAVGTLSDFACSVYPVSCNAEALLAAETTLANAHSIYSSALPSTGEIYTSKADGCYLDDGVTNQYTISKYNSDPTWRERVKYRIGSVPSSVTVLADRTSTNADGSSRRELDVLYKIKFTDGTTDEEVKTTLIYGSSTGTVSANGTLCTTPDNKQEWRIFGNRKVVGTSVTSGNYSYDRYSLQTGAALSPARLFKREIQFNVTDPGNVATYATITGPGVRGTYKFVSPRLLNTAPQFAGKVGNFVDWPEDDTFKACRESTGNNYADVAIADCTQYGAVSNIWGYTSPTTATVDSGFNAYGFVDGGQYTVKVYNDDGWKTVNGQANKTPIATYTTNLNRVPYSAVSMATVSANGLYVNESLSLAATDIATLFRTKASGSTNVTINTPPVTSSGVKVGWAKVYVYEQGRTTASTATNPYPATRQISYVHPMFNATNATLLIPTASVVMTTPAYGEIGVIYDDRNGHSLRTIVTFE